MTRGLSKKFIKDLQGGLLSPLLTQVREDKTICLEIRNDYLNIYYRGGNLMKLSQGSSGYSADFNTNYFRAGQPPANAGPSNIKQPADIDAWLKSFPFLKQAIDLFPKHNIEREVQQLIVADNNFWLVARSTDYYVCDIEYQSENGRFDVLAVHWPSTPAARKKQKDRRLVVAEVKYGDGALDGASGLHAHIEDVNKHLADPAKLSRLKGEMVDVFNQKRALGLIDCERDLLGFSEEKPLMLLILANHDPAKTKLCKLLNGIHYSPNAEVRVASASLLGYGLYDPAILTVEEALARLEAPNA